MATACLIILSSFVGQYTPFYARSFYPGYGFYGRTSLPWYDPIRYARYYSGSGYYSYVPPAIENPEVLVPKHSVSSLPGLTGLVVGLDSKKNFITLRLPTKTVSIPFGPKTQYKTTDGSFPEIEPGELININGNTITVLARGHP